MRTVVLTTSYPVHDDDPAGHFVQAEVRALVRAGHRVTVVAPRTPLAREPGVTHVQVGGGSAFGWPGVLARLRERPDRILSLLAWMDRTRRVLSSLPPFDLAIAHWAIPSAFPLTPSARTLEVVSHGADIRLLVALPGPARDQVVRRILERATRWRFVSQGLHDDLCSRLPIHLARRTASIAYIAACAIEMPDVAQERARIRRALGRARVSLSVGRLIHSKRVDRAISHAAQDGTDLLVVLGDGPERGSLERLARTSGLSTRFLGRVPRKEALAWIAAADQLLFASTAEGESTVLREARLLGTPVVDLRDRVG